MHSSVKIPLLKELGASDVIDTTKKPKWDEEARSLTYGNRVDHILEVVGEIPFNVPSRLRLGVGMSPLSAIWSPVRPPFLYHLCFLHP
jgi:NADPH:quinone reductase-like Zn-dependent oxidoreductase